MHNNWGSLEIEEDGNMVHLFKPGSNIPIFSMTKRDFELHRQIERTENPSIKKHLAVLGLAAGLCGCGHQSPLKINIDNQPKWVQEAFEAAADFWSFHDVDIDLSGGSGSIAVATDSQENIAEAFGEYQYLGDKIVISEGMEANTLQERTCVVAHEIGHALGMGHVSDGSSHNLMATVASLPTDGCYWGIEDQKELCRVNECPVNENYHDD